MSQILSSSHLISMEEGLRTVYNKMISHQQKGEYVDAERCRVEWQHRKEELKQRQLYQMTLRHQKERTQLTNDFNEQLKKMNEFWNHKMMEFQKSSEENILGMEMRHKHEESKLIEELQIQLSTKVKQSSELLNLRKMEEQMAKQKNYAEAHRVQQKIKKLYTHEEQVWLERRQEKINQAVFNLRNKHAAELANLKQRIKMTEQDNIKDHHFEEIRIRQRYENTLKDLKASQERECLSFKGEFKTLGGGTPPGSPSKTNKFGSEIKV